MNPFKSTYRAMIVASASHLSPLGQYYGWVSYERNIFFRIKKMTFVTDHNKIWISYPVEKFERSGRFHMIFFNDGGWLQLKVFPEVKY